MHIYLCKNLIGGLNIDDFIQKSPIAKINFIPRQCFVLYGISARVCQRSQDKNKQGLLVAHH